MALGIEQDDRGRFVMNPYVAHLIEGMAPFVRNMSRMMFIEDTYVESDKYFQGLSYLVGIKIKPVDTLQAQDYGTRKELAARRKQLRELGIEY